MDSLGEFEIIKKYFSFDPPLPSLKKGVGDDCAVLMPPAGQELLVSCDTMVENVHFPRQWPADAVAGRALGAATSDLAAMGALPWAMMLSLAMPGASQNWLQAFSETVHQFADEYEMPLVGGDTTHSSVVVITVHVMGLCENGSSLMRSGAESGDLIYVSGQLGDAAAALDYLADWQNARMEGAPMSDARVERLLERYNCPAPRLDLGRRLINIASSAIDISDGLIGDLSHICDAGQLGAEVWLDRVPLSAALLELKPETAISHALYGGDDYELCFTVPRKKAKLLDTIPFSVDITCIGEITSTKGIWLLDGKGNRYEAEEKSYRHFQDGDSL